MVSILKAVSTFACGLCLGSLYLLWGSKIFLAPSNLFRLIVVKRACLLAFL